MREPRTWSADEVRDAQRRAKDAFDRALDEAGPLPSPTVAVAALRIALGAGLQEFSPQQLAAWLHAVADAVAAGVEGPPPPVTRPN